MLGGLSGLRGLSGPISDPLDSESCIRSMLPVLNVSCFRRCSLLISSVMFCAIFSGVNFGQTASANGEGFGSITRIALFDEEAAAAAAIADDDGLFGALLLGLPKG